MCVSTSSKLSHTFSAGPAALLLPKIEMKNKNGTKPGGLDCVCVSRDKGREVNTGERAVRDCRCSE